MVNWLVVGIGDITTRRVIPAILAEPRSKLVGIVTRDARKAEAYGVPAWNDLKDGLAAADAVYIATPVFLHASQTILSLCAGKNVLCEKPMGMNYAEACSMEQAAREADRVLGIAYYRRLYPKVERARELMESGAIGRPVFAEATSHDWVNPVGGHRSWLADPKTAGGGPLYDIASHRIDLMNYFFGAPRRACGSLSTLVQPVPVEDNASVLIDYENGARGFLDVRWHSRVVRDEFRIRGTDGEIDLSPLNGDSLVFPGGREAIRAPENLHYPCVHDFVCAVLDRTALRSSGSSAMATDWVTEQVVNCDNCEEGFQRLSAP
ncbi:MAG TPA: Gfo/Idh/MocA family oxidoreductase [Bryobacteraceae bacterium]|nr:Gfo/Idh/MocA family oxidoreductase [Bryobacteraceae bacterium]